MAKTDTEWADIKKVDLLALLRVAMAAKATRNLAAEKAWDRDEVDAVIELDKALKKVEHLIEVVE